MTLETPTVIALGGNAISRAGEEGNIEQQFARTRESARLLVDLIRAGRHLIVTHGNGPQVGSVLRRVELAASEVYPLPLDVCGADTQGGMGYMIAQCLDNELRSRGIDRRATTVITQVEVDADDPAFQHPTKPIGGFYTKPKAQVMIGQLGWKMIEIPNRGFRRVVPSPRPRRIVEIELIRKLARDGELIVCGGGGGIPVVRNGEGDLRGVEAVIDKDRTSALLASAVGAGLFVVATDVERVAIDYGKPSQTQLSRLSIDEARRHLADGQFPAGSMGPKVEAAIDFLEQSERSGARAIICDMARLAEAVEGKSGTLLQR